MKSRGRRRRRRLRAEASRCASRGSTASRSSRSSAGSSQPTQEVAEKYGVAHATTELGEALARPGVERRHPVHADADACAAGDPVHEGRQARAGRDSARRQLGRCRRPSTRCSEQTGLVCMVGHTRRFNPSHQWMHKRIAAGELRIQQMDVQTYFFRRTNMNALGQPRSWTDHLLWHHAAHTVDLFRYQTGCGDRARQRDAGADTSASSASRWTCRSSSRPHRARSARCRCRSTTTGRSARSSATSATTAPTSRATTIWSTGSDQAIDVSKVDVSMNGIELQDREFFAAIREQREPNASVAQVLPCYRTLHELDQQLRAQA